jgi:uncharacterized repeat protein (TIGR01451 family)
MKTTRTVLISLFVLITLFFVFRSAEAAPGSPAAWLRGGESASWNTDEEPYDQITAWTVSAVQAASQQGQSITLIEPAVKPPVVQQAPNVSADLAVGIQDSPDPVFIGYNLTYTVIVTNTTAAATVANAIVTDTLPASVTIISTTPTQGTCGNLNPRVCNLGSMPGGSTAQVVIVVIPNTTGTITNSAEVGYTDPDVDPDIDPNPGNNTDSVNTTVDPLADLSITKGDSIDPVVAGDPLVYTLGVSNAGPSAAAGVTVTDTLPVALTSISVTPGAPTCTLSGQTLSCSLGTLVSGGSTSVTISGVVVSGTAQGTVLSNTAAVSATTSDPFFGNNQATQTTTVSASADLSITNVDQNDPVTAGSNTPGLNLVYVLTVTNLGPSNTTNAVITDTLPVGVTYQSFSGVDWDCQTITGDRVRCSRAGINNGTSSSVVLTLLVNSGTTGVLSNTAVVGSSTVDSITSNNTAVEATTVNTNADLSIAKVDNLDPVVAGTNLTYTVTVSNLGPSDAAGVVMTDTLPANVTYQSYTGVNWTCMLNAVKLRCVRTSNLAASANDRVVILTKVKSATTAALSNSVLVSATTTDPVSTNNSKTEATAVQTSADLKINKLDTFDPVVAGEGMAYTIVITNTGPSDAVGVKITDTLPVGVSYVTHVPTPEWICQVVSGELRCSRSASVVASARLQIDVAVLVDSSVTSTLSNLVRVGSSTFDPVTANNADTELTAVSPQSDLGIVKVESVDPVVAGTNLTYTLTVSNAGSSHAANLVVTDTLPANVTYQSYGGSIGWTCTLLANNQLRCTRTSLNKNTSSVISVITKVKSSASGSLSNTAVVRSSWTDPSLSNNSVTIDTTVIQSADMSVNKTDNPDPVAEGQTLTYMVVVKNNGPSDAASVSLNELIPSAVTFVSAAPVPQGSCSGSGPVTCNLGSVVSGSVVTVTVTTTAKPVANVPKLISNTATVTTATQDSIPSNDSKMITTQVLPAADLQINLESFSGQVQTGQTMTYTLWITNTGPSIANNVVVTDTLPAEMTFKSSSISPVSSSPKLVWNLGNLAKNQSVSFTLVVDVKSPTRTLINSVATSSSIWDVAPANSQDQVSVNAVDDVNPTAIWRLPVGAEGILQVVNQIVLLEAEAADNVAVSYVRFYRWDPVLLKTVEIGNDYTAGTCQYNPSHICYQWNLDTRVLRPKWNEIKVQAYDASGHSSPDGYRILLKYFGEQIFLPLVRK